MTRKEKRILTVICTVMLAAAVLILIRFYHTATGRTNDLSAESRDFSTGYRCSTEASEQSKTVTADAATIKRTFTHKLYTPENNYLVTATITVTGMVSGDNKTITHLSTSLSGNESEGLTISEHITEDTATVILYRNQFSVCHLQYRISQDGTIAFL